MTNKKNDSSDFIESIKDQFDAESDTYEPDRDDLQFIDERNRLEEETAWRTDMYAENYQQLKIYGLEDKLMRELDHTIRYWLKNRTKEFFKSEFYRQFRDHEVVAKEVQEYLKSKKQ